MMEGDVFNPIRFFIEHLHGMGRTPRLYIDGRRSDVDIPESVRKRWGSNLIIDLDPSYPLQLVLNEKGVEADLAFQGLVWRCRFSWESIYLVVDRSTGRGIFIEAHRPPEQLPPELQWTPPRGRPELKLITFEKHPEEETEPPPLQPPSDPSNQRRVFRVIKGGKS
ncbi:MAG: ClpXP protease specificity-enhancing factor SspB [Sandaracinaceae bacterium]|nr:ClpXP protease specificity-enhancing factor SspB [Sandaracinaceae bacterium]